MRGLVLILVGLAVVLAGVSQAVAADTFTAPYVQSSPTIDGTITAGEWSAAASHTVDMLRTDGGGDHTATIYAQHDGTYLYLGADSGWGSGWDVFWQFDIDGNHDGQQDGNLSSPHIDIATEMPSPDGWSGYNGYWALTSPTNIPRVTDPPGSLRASALVLSDDDVTYEFRVPLSDLGVQPGDSIGVLDWLATDGSADHCYFSPGISYGTGVTDLQPATWATVILAPVPEPSTLVLVVVGGITLAAYAWRRKRRATAA